MAVELEQMEYLQCAVGRIHLDKDMVFPAGK